MKFGGTQASVRAHAKWLQSCLTLCDPMDCSLPGSSVHGIPQARILEWVAISFSWGASRPRDQTCVPLCVLHWQAGYLPRTPPGKLTSIVVEVSQSCPTLRHPLDHTVHGILQARILESVAFPFSWGSSQPRSPALQADSLPTELSGKPK